MEGESVPVVMRPDITMLFKELKDFASGAIVEMLVFKANAFRDRCKLQSHFHNNGIETFRVDLKNVDAFKIAFCGKRGKG